MLTEHTTEPERVLYMQLPDGRADVWLRRDIQEVDNSTEDQESKCWRSDEVYMRTDLTLDEVEASFDMLFDTGAPTPTPKTIEERVTDLEQTALDIQEAEAELYEALFAEGE